LKLSLPLPIFDLIAGVASQMEVEAYVVGGYVRDLLLQRECKDIDIVVVGEGVAFANKIALALYNKDVKVNVFKNFGTAQIKLPDLDIEFVGARKESYNRNSRKPVVENGTFEEDILRRDFTINSMAISLNNNFGELVDLYDGLGDLKKKILRTPQNPEITFSDDPLRMMRAVRFASQLDFSLSETVFDAIVKNKERISIISAERITDEFNKILMAQKPSIGLNYLFETKLLNCFFSELYNLQGVEFIGKKGHKDNFYHTLEVVDKVSHKSDNIWLRWAALLHDIAKPVTKKFVPEEGWTFHAHEYIGEKMASRIFSRFKLPQGEILKYVQKLVRLHLRPIVLSENDITDSAIRRLLFDAGNDIDDLMMLCEADITSKNEKKVKKYIQNLYIVKQKLVEIEEKDRIREFQPPISGEEIMNYFDLKPCREVGVIKNAIKDAILDGLISNNYDDAFKYMLDVAKKNNILPLKN